MPGNNGLPRKSYVLQASIMSHDIYGDEEAMQASFDPMFRWVFTKVKYVASGAKNSSIHFSPRTQSNLSVPGSSTRVSPSMEHPFDDFEFPSWVNDATAASAAANAANHGGAAPIPTDILDRTDQVRIKDLLLFYLGSIMWNGTSLNLYTSSAGESVVAEKSPNVWYLQRTKH